MAKTKTLNQDSILSSYMEYFMEEHTENQKVYHFCKKLGIAENEFYTFFTSLEQIQSYFFESLFIKTLKLLNENEEYNHFDSKNKLASLYFTFFEMLTANRSYVLAQLKGIKLENFQKLSQLKSLFSQFIESLDLQGMEIENETFKKFEKKGMNEAAWGQFLLVLKFWMQDTSKGFEKTDIFIEKSLKASFDLMDFTPLKSLFDLGKFIYKETFKTA